MPSASSRQSLTFIVGWLIVYQKGMCYLYPVANAVRPSVEVGEMIMLAYLGVRNISRIEARPNSLDRIEKGFQIPNSLDGQLY